MRTRVLVIVAVSVVLGVFLLMAARSSADPILVIDGVYADATPPGAGIHDVIFTRGTWVYTAPVIVSDLEVQSAGAFPFIDVTDPSGHAKITFSVVGDPSQIAVFDMPSPRTAWGDNPIEGFITPVILESNTIHGADLSPFDFGGTLRFSTSGVTVDPTTNSATVSDTAMGFFSLQAAPIPEPTAALLAVIGGFVGLIWIWRTRPYPVGV